MSANFDCGALEKHFCFGGEQIGVVIIKTNSECWLLKSDMTYIHMLQAP